MGRTDESPFTESIPQNLLREPLEYLFADHMRQTTICALIYELSEYLDSRRPGEAIAPETRLKIEHALHYLNEDLALHIADEEMDILPRLRARGRPEDGIAAILREMSTQHARDENLSEKLVAALKTVLSAPDISLPEKISAAAGAFAESHCGHMKWENDVLLPLARKRLTPDDQAQIGRTMARRRGVPYPS